MSPVVSHCRFRPIQFLMVRRCDMSLPLRMTILASGAGVGFALLVGTEFSAADQASTGAAGALFRSGPERSAVHARCRQSAAPARLLPEARAGDRNAAVPAAGAGRRGRRCRQRCAALRRSRRLELPHHHEKSAGAALLRSRLAARLRLQSRRGAARVPYRAEARSRLRDVRLGRGAGARSQHQRADGAPTPSRRRLPPCARRSRTRRPPARASRH